ncbi:MAG: hypothetical protein JWN93_2422 [Hyphomicrobiales bacterium]|nr:hypothetical protein [Hyphomicrobiales bacterium]
MSDMSTTELAAKVAALSEGDHGAAIAKVRGLLDSARSKTRQTPALLERRLQLVRLWRDLARADAAAPREKAPAVQEKPPSGEQEGAPVAEAAAVQDEATAREGANGAPEDDGVSATLVVRLLEDEDVRGALLPAGMVIEIPREHAERLVEARKAFVTSRDAQ